jgi:hypothetical protein
LDRARSRPIDHHDDRDFEGETDDYRDDDR